MKTFKNNTDYGDMSGQTVDYSIDCSNLKLNSLEGSPKIVKGAFTVPNNKLQNLKGGPREVQGDYDCYDCQLDSLEGSPESVGMDFNCFGNNLTSLKGGPKFVHRTFNCSENDIKNPLEEVMMYQIKADTYIFDEIGRIEFKDIEKEFNEYIKNTYVKRKGFRTLLGLNK